MSLRKRNNMAKLICGRSFDQLRSGRSRR